MIWVSGQHLKQNVQFCCLAHAVTRAGSFTAVDRDFGGNMTGIGKIASVALIFIALLNHSLQAQQGAPDTYRFHDPEQQIQFLRGLDWLPCKKTQAWLIECTYAEAKAVINIKGDARNRTLQFSFNMHDAISTKISRIINLIGLPFNGLEQCARRGQTNYHNDYINLDCKARGFNAIIITLAQYNPPPQTKW